MNILKSICLIGIVVIFASYAEGADSSASIAYENNGVGFSHKENWKVTGDEEEDDLRYMFVEGPVESLFIVLIYLQQDAVTLNEFAGGFSEQMNEEYSIAEGTQVEFSDIEKITHDVSLKGIREELSIGLLGQSIPHRREYYRVEGGNKVAFLISQVATQDIGTVDAGFDVLIGSFSIQ